MPSRTVIGPESKQPVRSQSLIDFGHLKLPQLALALDLDLGLWLLLAVGGWWQLAGRWALLAFGSVLFGGHGGGWGSSS